MTAGMVGDLRRVARRVLLTVGRGRIKTVDDSGAVQLHQVQLGENEVIDKIPAVKEYGFTSRPPVDSDAIILCIAGDRSNPIVIATNGQAVRLKNLEEGEVALYTDDGKRIHLKKDGGILISAAGQQVVVTEASDVSVTASGGVSVSAATTVTVSAAATVSVSAGASVSLEAAGVGSFSAGADLGLTGGAAASLSAGGDVAVSGGGAASLSAGGMAAVSAGGDASLSAGGLAAVGAPLVMLGLGAGNIGAASGSAQGMFSDVASAGPGAVLSNPVEGSLSALDGSLAGSTITSGLDGLVSSAVITLAERNDIVDALTGAAGSLLDAVTELTTHTDLLSGLLDPSASTQPFLDGVIGLAGGLDYLAGGLLGDAATLLPIITSALGAGGAVGSANSYINGIVALLTADPTQVPTVVATILAHAGTLQGYVTSDTANYGAAQSEIQAAAKFFTLVGAAKSPIPAVQALVSQLASAGDIATLQSV